MSSCAANSEFCPNVQTVRDVELLLESSSFEMSYAAAHLLVCPFAPFHYMRERNWEEMEPTITLWSILPNITQKWNKQPQFQPFYVHYARGPWNFGRNPFKNLKIIIDWVSSWTKVGYWLDENNQKYSHSTDNNYNDQSNPKINYSSNNNYSNQSNPNINHSINNNFLKIPF